MKPATKYWIFLLAVANLIFGVIIASVFGAWFTLDPQEQDFILGIVEKILPFPLLGALILFLAIGALISLLFRHYIIPILQLAENTRMITTVNPDYRIPPRGARELVYLTEVINDSAEAFQKLNTEVDEKIRNARSDMQEERNRLAALMSELPHGVLVCNSDGQILLYNAKAQELLQPKGGQNLPGESGAGWIGLGRSVFSILNRSPIVHALALLQQALRKNQSMPTSGFMMTLPGSTCLRVNMAPVLGRKGQVQEITGLVLTLEDMTRQIEADTRRDILIRTLTEGLQSALTDIRESIVTIMETPELKPGELEKNRQTIDQASLRLQKKLNEARENYAHHLQALSREEHILAENLFEILQKNIQERLGIEVHGEAAKGLWLRLDSYSLVQAISHLAGLLKDQKHFGRFQIRLERAGGNQAVMTIAWPDYCLDQGFISDWVQSPLITDTEGKLLSFSDVVARHDGQVFIDPVGSKACHEVRIEFAEDRDEDKIEITSAPEPRPVSYEFDLFRQRGLEALWRQPLRKLTYVVFDTETTGLSPSLGDEIIQIGAVRIVNGRVLQEETIDQLVDPRRPVPDESIKIHGIDPTLLGGQPLIEEVLPGFHRFVEGAVLVAHNAAFDMRFLQLKEKRAQVHFDNPVLDTLLLSSIVHPHQESHSLDAIAARFHLALVGRHTALGDALVTAEVLLKLIPLLEAQNIHTLEEAVQASAGSRYAKFEF